MLIGGFISIERFGDEVCKKEAGVTNHRKLEKNTKESLLSRVGREAKLVVNGVSSFAGILLISSHLRRLTKSAELKNGWWKKKGKY